jgi:hypothetical protein
VSDSDFDNGDRFPTADQAAAAIVAACRETGADPIKCLQGVSFDHVIGRNNPARYCYSRARIYAAMAIRQLFNCGAVAVGRIVGSRSSGCLLSNIDFQMRNDKMRWYDGAAKDRVVAAVLAAGPVLDLEPRLVQSKSPSYSCCDCGKPLKTHSRQCRDCYRGLTEQSARKRTSRITDPLASAIVAAFEPAAVKVEPCRDLVVRTSDPLEFRTPIVVRRAPTPADQCHDLTAELMGDPAPQRSALAGARPWRPYEPETREVSP